MVTHASNLRFQLKEYCNFYMKKIVEEMVLPPNPIEFHYGKCAIIGETCYDKIKNFFYLNNLELIGLDKSKYKTKDGQYKILLLTAASPKTIISSNKYIEAYGEVGFLLKNTKIFDNNKTIASCLTPNDFVRKIGQIQQELESEFGLKPRKPTGLSDTNLNANIRRKLLTKLDEFKENYEPAFILHDFNFLQDPHELIKVNMLCKTARMRLMK